MVAPRPYGCVLGPGPLSNRKEQPTGHGRDPGRDRSFYPKPRAGIRIRGHVVWRWVLFSQDRKKAGNRNEKQLMECMYVLRRRTWPNQQTPNPNKCASQALRLIREPRRGDSLVIQSKTHKRVVRSFFSQPNEELSLFHPSVALPIVKTFGACI
jgi:hypothetical protein